LRRTALAGAVIVAVLIGAGAGYLYGNANERTITSVSTSMGQTVTITYATTLIDSTTLTQTTTTAFVVTSTATLVRVTTAISTVAAGNQWYGLIYLDNESNCAVSTDPPTTWYEIPCLGFNADPVVFNCAAAAASPEGCTLRVNTTGEYTPQPSGPNYFTVTIWYPYVNDTAGYPGVNCKYIVPSVPTPPGPQGPYYGYCISLNSTAFIVTQRAPPPV